MKNNMKIGKEQFKGFDRIVYIGMAIMLLINNFIIFQPVRIDKQKMFFSSEDYDSIEIDYSWSMPINSKSSNIGRHESKEPYEGAKMLSTQFIINGQVWRCDCYFKPCLIEQKDVYSESIHKKLFLNEIQLIRGNKYKRCLVESLSYKGNNYITSEYIRENFYRKIYEVSDLGSSIYRILINILISYFFFSYVVKRYNLSRKIR